MVTGAHSRRCLSRTFSRTPILVLSYLWVKVVRCSLLRKGRQLWKEGAVALWWKAEAGRRQEGAGLARPDVLARPPLPDMSTDVIAIVGLVSTFIKSSWN